MMKLNIQDRMKDMDLNKNQLSKLIKVGYPGTCAIYKGDTARISFDTLENLCIALDCTPNDILVSDEKRLQDMMDASKYHE